MASRLISQLKASRLLVYNQLSKLNSRSLHLTGSDKVPMELKMPALSPTMSEGTIIKWFKKEGDSIVPGDLLMEIQTDKAVIPYELEEDGTLAKILVEESSIVQVGDLIGVLALPGEDWKTVSVPDSSSASAPTTSQTIETKQPEKKETKHLHSSHDGYLKIMPGANILINEYQINPSSIPEIGHRGFISKSDVKEYIIKNNLTPASLKAGTEPHVASTEPQVTSAQTDVPKKSSNPNVNPEYEPDFEDIELTNMRKVIAKRLVLSKTTIPHSYINTTAVMDKVIELRKGMIANGQKVSLNDFIIKAAALTLKLVPEVNSNQVGDGFAQSPTADISIAVATDNGLITPIITRADQSCVTNISERVKALADKARRGKLQPHEFQGGSFSISNLGMFGISEFSAVINPPQTAILAVGGSKSTFNTDMQQQSEASFTLSYDARCVELDRAYKFMNTFKYFLANPDLLVEQTQTF